MDVKRSDLERLASLVRDETGNQVREKNFSMLESRIKTHLMRLSINSMEEYWEYFERNEMVERQVIQGLMTTHYTFFFRETVHFEVLEKWLADNLPRLQERYRISQAPVRIWSAASSRGQEVYSLALYLDVHFTKKTGIPFHVVGTDIDVESINYAKNAVYPLKEVNTIPQMYLSSYWRKGTGPIKDFAAVHPTIKSRTEFEVLNLLNLEKWRPNYFFDVVFCRNVFIYFSDENVRNVAIKILDKMAPESLFISGVSEPLRFEGWTLENVGPSSYAKGTKKAERPRYTSENVTRTPAPKTPSVVPLTPAPETAAVAAQNVRSLESELKREIAKSDHEYSVLCVDDSPTIQMLIKKVFSVDKNCKVVDFAENGKIAREKLDAKKYDLITLDIHMPEVNGIDFLQKLYRKRSDPPVIMISSVNRSDIDLATKSLSLGAFDYVEKPAMNNLSKSADEILTKAKMALRVARSEDQDGDHSFDKSISQKIVVPDASMCLRVISASKSSLPLLKFVIDGQKEEFRSPPVLIIWNGEQDLSLVESNLLNMSARNITTLREPKAHLRPNHIYVVQAALAKDVIAKTVAKSVSLQILDRELPEFVRGQSVAKLQILVEEGLSNQVKEIESKFNASISDIVPAISFASLSVEFFAQIRKAAA